MSPGRKARPWKGERTILLPCVVRPLGRESKVEPFRLFVVLMLVAIVYNLGAAFFSLSRSNRDPARDSRNMVRSLTWRISLSVALFGLLFLAWHLGWVQPHSLGGR